MTVRCGLDKLRAKRRLAFAAGNADAAWSSWTRAAGVTGRAGARPDRPDSRDRARMTWSTPAETGHVTPGTSA